MKWHTLQIQIIQYFSVVTLSVGRQKVHLVCRKPAAAIQKTLALDTGITWINIRNTHSRILYKKLPQQTWLTINVTQTTPAEDTADQSKACNFGHVHASSCTESCCIPFGATNVYNKNLCKKTWHTLNKLVPVNLYKFILECVSTL